MQKLIALAILITSQLALAGSTIIQQITFFNYVNESGAVFLGIYPQPEVLGPQIGPNGATVEWNNVPLNGKQIVGLQVSPGNPGQQICYVTGGQLALNSAIYQGDTISIVYGQPQLPTGISCGCLGSACDIA